MQIRELEENIYELDFDGAKLYINQRTGKVSRGFNKEVLLDKSYNPDTIDKKPGFNYFLFDVTFDCTLRCRYCYNEFYAKREKKHIDKELAKFFLDKIFDYLEKKRDMRFRLIFHGGEPMLHPETVEFICRYIERNDFLPFAHIGMQSNATVVSMKLIRVLRKYNVHVGVSIDGTEDIHNKLRVFPNGKGSFDRTVEGIRLMQKHGVKVGPLTVLTKYNAHRIDEVYRFLMNLGLNNSGIVFCFNRPEYIPTPEQYSIFAHKTALTVLREMAKGRYFSVREFEYVIKHILTPNRWGCWSSPCMGAREFISITYTGDTFPCNRINVQEWNLGNLFDKDFKDIERGRKAKEWRSRFWRNIKECSECIIGAICQGYCASTAYYKYGDIHKPTELCEHLKAFIFKVMELHAKGILTDRVVRRILQGRSRLQRISACRPSQL